MKIIIIIKAKPSTRKRYEPEKSIFDGMSDKVRKEYIASLDELDKSAIVRGK
jgi:hypothetical protein